MKDILQLIKKSSNLGYLNIYPNTFIDAIIDKLSGKSLKDILNSFNMYFLSYDGNTEHTRLLVPYSLRKQGLWITYVKFDKTVTTEWYNGDLMDDNSWKNGSNWVLGSNMLQGDITISGNGNWIINGIETSIPARGEKGITPQIRIYENKLLVSYTNGTTWKYINDTPIAAWFRFLGDVGANIGKILISRDEGKTWSDLSNNFTNNLYIKGYVATQSNLPVNAVLGDIYGVGPTYDSNDIEHTSPIYKLFVKNNTGWVNNGNFTSINAGIVQEIGNSETEVMSLAAVTKELSKLDSEVSHLENIIDGEDICNIVGEDIDRNTGLFVEITSEYKPYFSRSALISLNWFDNYKQLGLQLKTKNNDFRAFYYDVNKHFIKNGGVYKDDIPSNARYVAFRTYVNTLIDSNIRNPITFYNFGLTDITRDILRATTLGGVTDNINTNKIVEELYLEGLDENIEYGIYKVAKYVSVGLLLLYKYGEGYTNGGFVAEGSILISDVNKGKRIVKIEPNNDSLVKGYAVINFDLLNTSEGINTFSLIRKDRVKSLDLNPSIKSYLSKLELEESIDDVKVIYDFTDGLDVSTITKDSYSVYETGVLAVAGINTQIDRYNIPVNDEILVRCYCGMRDSVPAAIAFYSSKIPDKNSYIKDFSIQGEQTDGKWFEAKIPSNAKSLTMSNVRSLVTNPIIKLGKVLSITETRNNIEEVKDNILTSAYITKTIPSTWVKVSDGSLVAASDIHTTLKYSVKGLSKIKVTGMWYDNLAAAIAFFKEDGTYLSKYTVSGISTSVAVTLESTIPSEACYALSCSARNFVPIIETEQIGQIVKDLVNYNIKEKNESVNNLLQINKLNSATIHSIVYPTNSYMDYHHLFIDKIYTNSEVTIPCQSVFDVYVAAKLGFNMIEVNVLETSDGVAVTGHQVGTGNLQTLTNLEGVNTEVNIPSITFEKLRTNYRYKSIYPQYRTPITSLEEFLHECKRYNLTPFVQCVSESVVKLTESIMGKRYVAYNGNRNWTDVTIYEYKGGTIDEIVERCKSIGAPYIFGVSAPILDKFTNDEVKELVKRVHTEGCWLGWAGSYHSVENTLRYKSLGLDLNASGWDVPDFEIGDEAFIYGNSIKGFRDFDGDYTVDKGVAKLINTLHMSKYLEQKSIISKGSLHIQFKGKISITFGKVATYLTSDGLKEVVITSIIENTSPKLYLYAYNNVEIYSISYKVSSVI